MKTGRKCATEDLSKLSQEELIARVKQLEAHVLQLKNLLAKKSGSDEKIRELEKPQRTFDFSRCSKRHVALRICYLGWDFHGLAVQESEKTIESELFKALVKTKLIECRENANYHRSGRTDKGVSAFHQVISIDLRSNMKEKGLGVILPAIICDSVKAAEHPKELEYVNILNKVLPPEIRAVAWAPVEPGFSARFNCLHRTYKYIFPKGSLNIDLMNSAGQDLVGEHDFRNFCKMDVANGVITYKRKILHVEISPLTPDSEGPYQLYELTVTGQAFLWHQIRCLTALLFLIGQKKEDRDIVKQLLDVESNPCKPQYSMVSELPLILFNCEYENLKWQVQQDALVALIKHLQEHWMKYSIQSAMIRRMLHGLENGSLTDGEQCLVHNQNENLMQGNKMRTYKKLLERPKCESLQDRMEHYAKRRKCEQKSETETREIADAATQ